MAAAGRRPVKQASGTRPLPAPEPGPRGRAWQGASPAAQPTQGAGERREAGQEAVTGQERGESGNGNALLQTPPCWHGEPLRAVISLATRPALGDNGPPNRRSRETDRHAHQRPRPEGAAGTCGHLLADPAWLPGSGFCLKSLLCGARSFQLCPAVLSVLPLPPHALRFRQTRPDSAQLELTERLFCASAIFSQAP